MCLAENVSVNNLLDHQTPGFHLSKLNCFKMACLALGHDPSQACVEDTIKVLVTVIFEKSSRTLDRECRKLSFAEACTMTRLTAESFALPGTASHGAEQVFVKV